MMAETLVVQQINICDIKIDGSIQARVRMSQQAIDDYSEAISEGKEFKPVDVFQEGKEFWLADGFHRVPAYKAAGHKTIWATIHEGGRREAILFAVGCNEKHGVRRTPEDRQRSVQMLLRDPEWAKWSGEKIAQACNVSRRFVCLVQADMKKAGEELERANGKRTCERNGQTYEMECPQPQTADPKIESLKQRKANIVNRNVLEKVLMRLRQAEQALNQGRGLRGRDILMMIHAARDEANNALAAIPA